MRIYVIADTHFGHANMVKYHNRPQQFDRRPAESDCGGVATIPVCIATGRAVYSVLDLLTDVD